MRGRRTVGLLSLCLAVSTVLVGQGVLGGPLLGRGALSGGADKRAHGHAHRVAPAPRPGQVRSSLEQALGNHVILAVRMTRAEVSGTPDFVQSVQDAFRKNTADLTAIVGSIYGTSGGETFRDLWIDHIVALTEYSQGLKQEDDALMKESMDKLDRYRAAFGDFVESATEKELDAETVSGALKTHIDHLIEQVEAYAAGDYAQAYALQREAYAHMFPTGRTLARGFSEELPGELPVKVERPTQELKSALARLLGEHVQLVVDTTRAGLRGAPEFKQAAGALNDNTKDLSEAVATVFGAKGGRQFNDIWSHHIDQFLDYTVATAENNKADADAARRRLDAFAKTLGSFLIRATRNKQSVAAMSGELLMHDDLLLQQVDTYAAENYDAAHELSYHAYQDMFNTAEDFAVLIAKEVKGAIPAGGAQTGGGGTS